MKPFEQEMREAAEKYFEEDGPGYLGMLIFEHAANAALTSELVRGMAEALDKAIYIGGLRASAPDEFRQDASDWLEALAAYRKAVAGEGENGMD